MHYLTDTCIPQHCVCNTCQGVVFIPNETFDFFSCVAIKVYHTLVFTITSSIILWRGMKEKPSSGIINQSDRVLCS